MKSVLKSIAVAGLLSILGLSIFGLTIAQEDYNADLNRIAEDYVRLVLRVGQYDSTYVDAYFGPESWKPQSGDSITTSNFPYEQLRAEVERLIAESNEIREESQRGGTFSRYKNLSRMLNSVKWKIELLNGKKMTFDEESKALFGFVEPVLGDTYYLNILKELDSIIPGEGNIGKRYLAYEEKFLVPSEKAPTAFSLALKEARRLTRSHIELPENEDFTTEFVSNKPWAGFCRYMGGNKSHIQVNTDRYFAQLSVALACHEGYPGHHVRAILMDNNLRINNGWIELLVYPLYSPLSIIDEGCADYAIDFLFPLEKRIDFEKNYMFPILGLDSSEADSYFRIRDKVHALGKSFNETARMYLDGIITRDSAYVRMEQLTLYPWPEPGLKFIEQYRSYCITYTLGKQVVKDYMGPDSLDEEVRWDKFARLQANPTLLLDKVENW